MINTLSSSANHLTAARSESGMSIGEFAALTGLSEARIRQIEDGSEQPRVEEFVRLASLVEFKIPATNTASADKMRNEESRSTDGDIDSAELLEVIRAFSRIRCSAQRTKVLNLIGQVVKLAP